MRKLYGVSFTFFFFNDLSVAFYDLNGGSGKGLFDSPHLLRVL